MAHIRLDRSALAHNVDLIRRQSGGRFAAVLKDNANGHGLELIAKELAALGVTQAVVRSRAEAQRIAQWFDDILILADTPQKDSFSYAINDFGALKSVPRGARVELKVDTGMHRNGIAEAQMDEAVALCAKRGLELIGIFTHYRGADSLDSSLFWQRSRWEHIKGRARALCEALGLPRPRFHSANSAALFRAGLADDDFARVGIALYGYLEFDGPLEVPPLRPVLSLWARRISTRRLNEGERVGYGGTYEAAEPMVVSSYDVGYADGIFRAMRTTAAGPVLGRVSMDSVVVAGEAEEICVFRDAKAVARELGTISYEVLVKLPAHLQRRWIETT